MYRHKSMYGILKKFMDKIGIKRNMFIVIQKIWNPCIEGLFEKSIKTHTMKNRDPHVHGFKIFPQTKQSVNSTFNRLFEVFSYILSVHDHYIITLELSLKGKVGICIEPISLYCTN